MSGRNGSPVAAASPVRFEITLPGRPLPGLPELPGFVTDPRRGTLERHGTPERFDHLARIGHAAELAGLAGAIAPFDPAGDESLVAAAGLLRRSRHLRVTAQFHPGIATPVYAAKLSASLQRFSGDRLGWWPLVELDPAVARSQGDFLEGHDRYARADEFLTVARGVWQEEGYTVEGRFYEVLDGGFPLPLSGRPFPRVHLSGTSPLALELSARHADVHVLSPEDDVEGARAALRSAGRAPEVAVRLPVLAREDDGEAWRDARRLWAREGGTDDTLPEPDPRTGLWGGFGAPGLVGSYAGVASALRGLAGRGVSAFLLEARPYVAETYRLGEHLLPLFESEPVPASEPETVKEIAHGG